MKLNLDSQIFYDCCFGQAISKILAKIKQVLVQNVFYAITHLRQLSIHFLNFRK